MEQQPFENFYLPPEQNDYYKKGERSNLSRIGIAFTVYMVLTTLISYAIAYVVAGFFPAYYEHPAMTWILQIVPGYLIGFPIFAGILKGMPKKRPEKRKLGYEGWITFLAVSFFAMIAGSYLASIVMTGMEALRGTEITNAIDQQITESSPLMNLIVVVILAPIVEELMCRKLVLDRLLPYSETLAVVTGGLIFGLLHGNLYQFFYATFLGMVFSYIYVKTGNILHTILMHMIINFTGSIVADFILKMSSDLASAPTSINPWDVVSDIYNWAMTLLVACGIILLIRKVKNLGLQKTGDRWLTLSTQFKLAWCNPGMIVYCILCAITFVGSLFI
ncbi:MAG: CPBP family intramembrane metalloprotease [Clostridia bacterium]|nr:CPBP family intramembrane metalloprotease [Clostridia bacterium]